jgi:hypothetical protein
MRERGLFMTKLTLDDFLRAKLNGLNEQMEVCDESGLQVGYFLPREIYQQMLDAWIRTWVSDEEIDRLSRETEGRPLAEIWESLGRKITAEHAAFLERLALPKAK